MCVTLISNNCCSLRFCFMLCSFFFRPAKYTIKRRNLELSMRHSTVSSAHSLLVCVLSTIAYSPFEWNEESEIKYTQSNQRSRGYFNRSTTRFISKKNTFFEYQLFSIYQQNEQTNIKSALLFHSIAFSMFYNNVFIFGHFDIVILHCKEYSMDKFIKSTGNCL